MWVFWMVCASDRKPTSVEFISKPSLESAASILKNMFPNPIAPPDVHRFFSRPSSRQLWYLLLLLSHSVVSDSLQPHGLQHARIPCPSPSPRVCSNSCPRSRWCHPTLSSSVALFSSNPQCFPASGSFLMSQPFTSGGHRTPQFCPQLVPLLTLLPCCSLFQTHQAECSF